MHMAFLFRTSAAVLAACAVIAALATALGSASLFADGQDDPPTAALIG
jgi:hypothetical protein